MIVLQQVESNRTTPVTGIDRTTVDTECYYFHVTDHLSNNCPEVTVERCRNRGAGDRGSGGRTGTGMCQIRVGLAQHDYGIVPYTWLLLDACSTSSVGKNTYMFNKLWNT